MVYCTAEELAPIMPINNVWRGDKFLEKKKVLSSKGAVKVYYTELAGVLL